MKWAGVNSVFLVHLRKTLAADFLGLTPMNRRLKGASLEREMTVVLLRSEERRKNVGKWGGEISTAGAQEIQKESVAGIRG